MYLNIQSHPTLLQIVHLGLKYLSQNFPYSCGSFFRMEQSLNSSVETLRLNMYSSLPRDRDLDNTERLTHHSVQSIIEAEIRESRQLQQIRNENYKQDHAALRAVTDLDDAFGEERDDKERVYRETMEDRRRKKQERHDIFRAQEVKFWQQKMEREKDFRLQEEVQLKKTCDIQEHHKLRQKELQDEYLSQRDRLLKGFRKEKVDRDEEYRQKEGEYFQRKQTWVKKVEAQNRRELEKLKTQCQMLQSQLFTCQQSIKDMDHANRRLQQELQKTKIELREKTQLEERSRLLYQENQRLLQKVKGEQRLQQELDHVRKQLAQTDENLRSRKEMSESNLREIDHLRHELSRAREISGDARRQEQKQRKVVLDAAEERQILVEKHREEVKHLKEDLQQQRRNGQRHVEELERQLERNKRDRQRMELEIRRMDERRTEDIARHSELQRIPRTSSLPMYSGVSPLVSYFEPPRNLSHSEQQVLMTVYYAKSKYHERPI